MLCICCKDGETKEWDNKTNNIIKHLKDTQKAGKKCFLKRQVGRRDSRYEVALVNNFKSIDDDLLYMKRMAVEQLTPHQLPHQRLAHKIDFHSQQVQYQMNILRIQKEHVRLVQERKALLDENLRLRKQLNLPHIRNTDLQHDQAYIDLNQLKRPETPDFQLEEKNESVDVIQSGRRNELTDIISKLKKGKHDLEKMIAVQAEVIQRLSKFEELGLSKDNYHPENSNETTVSIPQELQNQTEQHEDYQPQSSITYDEDLPSEEPSLEDQYNDSRRHQFRDEAESETQEFLELTSELGQSLLSLNNNSNPRNGMLNQFKRLWKKTRSTTDLQTKMYKKMKRQRARGGSEQNEEVELKTMTKTSPKVKAKQAKQKKSKGINITNIRSKKAEGKAESSSKKKK